MKKIVSILFVMAMMISAFALAGCGSQDEGEAPSADSQYIGVWEPTTATFKDEEVSVDEALDGDKFILELKEDGTAIVTDDEEATGTWTEKEDAVHVKAGDTDMDFTKTDDGNLSFEVMGFTLFFAKQ